jgi:hypothetical protein
VISGIHCGQGEDRCRDVEEEEIVHGNSIIELQNSLSSSSFFLLFFSSLRNLRKLLV